jgi:hypothetical protein
VEEEVAGCGKTAAPQASGKAREASKEKAGRVPGFFVVQACDYHLE